ncbi:MAG TPA: ABC transporter ATP-binding protein [Bacteroidota bacterium]
MTATQGIIELKEIAQWYMDDKGRKTVVIEHFNLMVENVPKKGQFICLLGPSGCGKSTVLRYIAGLQTPSEGQVLLYGKPRREEDHVGMVFQQYSSFPWLTVLDNVTLALEIKGVAKKERKEQAMSYIQACDLEKHADKYAQYPILSGGQLQRVAIARSLVSNPNLLLMDEPFGALDVNTRLRMQEMLMTIWERLWHINTATTIVFVTHDIPEAVYLGTDIYIMQANPGKIVHHIAIDLPFDKTRQVKRDPRFVQYVYGIEDKMMALSQEKAVTASN